MENPTKNKNTKNGTRDVDEFVTTTVSPNNLNNNTNYNVNNVTYGNYGNNGTRDVDEFVTTTVSPNNNNMTNSTKNTKNTNNVKYGNYGNNGLDDFNEDPNYYLTKVDETIENKNDARAFFNFYDKKKKDIYDTITQSLNNTKILPDLNTLNSNTFFSKNKFNTDIIMIKIQNQLICDNGILNSYIKQSKLDWERLQKIPLYSSKFHKFFKINTYKYGIDDNNSILQYLDNKINYNLFITTVNSIFNYLSIPNTKNYDEKLIEENVEIPYNKSVNNILCGCEKQKDNRYNHCKTIKSIDVNNKKLKVLYKLLPLFQSSFIVIIEALNSYLITLNINTELLPSPSVHYYIDSDNQTFVLLINIYLKLTDFINIPMFKFIQVYPLNVSEFSYGFLYIDNSDNSYSESIIASFFKRTPTFGDRINDIIKQKTKWYSNPKNIKKLSDKDIKTYIDPNIKLNADTHRKNHNVKLDYGATYGGRKILKKYKSKKMTIIVKKVKKSYKKSKTHIHSKNRNRNKSKKLKK